MQRLWRRVAFWGWAILWSLLLLLPHPMSFFSMGGSRLVREAVHWDKVVHAISYLMLYLIGRLAYGSQPRTRELLLVACVLHGMLSELCQRWIPDRTSDPNDLLANSLGLLIGVAVAAWFQRRREIRVPR